ncbi:GGDEF domain-containing protein [Rhodobacterales bacterium]|nr:GGDEF domain-containing protein [Rhodobacterales bacterium]
MRHIDWSATGPARVYALTAGGTAFCIAVAFAVDSFSLSTLTWRWGSDPIKNLIIPLLVAPPFFFILLNKMRQLSIAHRELAELAATDSLTSMLNRRAFGEVVEGYIERMAKIAERPTDALLVIDVDHFKGINDTFGHDIGDDALKLIARTIRSTLTDTDLAGRLGGEEFAIFLPGKLPEQVSRTAETMRAAIDSLKFQPEDRPHPLSISIGGIIFKETLSFRDLYRQADKQLYFAKNNGRNRVELDMIGGEMPGRI